MKWPDLIGVNLPAENQLDSLLDWHKMGVKLKWLSHDNEGEAKGAGFMDQKDIEKAIQLILDQQAKFATDIQQLGEAQKQAEGRISRLEGAVVTGINLVNDLTKNVSTLAEAQKQTENTVSELAEKVDAFITTVERYISEGRNGKPSA